jgi:hypothetical protein
MQNMAMNNKFKKIEKLLRTQMGLPLLTESLLPFSKTETTAARFHKVEKYAKINSD